MNWGTIEQIQKSIGVWYLTQTQVAAQVLGTGRPYAVRFLIEHNVPYYRVGKVKMYFLPEVLEAIETTRWKDAPEDLDEKIEECVSEFEARAEAKKRKEA